MNADELLWAALREGQIVRGRHVSHETWPDAARTYLADGTGMSWDVPADLRERGVFALDAEIIAPVRAPLARRYGITDPFPFAEHWTRAECLAKLADIPIITWLQRHGLGVPHATTELVEHGSLAWWTCCRDGAIITFAVVLEPPQNRAVPGLSAVNTTV